MVILPLPGCGHMERSTEISAVYDQYQEAVAARDGQTAANLVAAPALEEYETLRDLALTAEASDLQQQRATYQLMTLMLRQFSVPELNAGSNGREVFAIFVDHGGGSESQEGVQKQLTLFTFYGESASAMLQIDGRPTQKRIHFVQEDGIWKLDLRATYSDDDNLEAAARQAGMPLGDFLVSLVAQMTQPPPREDLWLPLQSREAA